MVVDLPTQVPETGTAWEPDKVRDGLDVVLERTIILCRQGQYSLV
jgi:hypothetical protein